MFPPTSKTESLKVKRPMLSVGCNFSDREVHMWSRLQEQLTLVYNFTYQTTLYFSYG
jgi:hypothetical protein